MIEGIDVSVIRVQPEPGVVTRITVLHPAGQTEPGPAVVFFHGHGRGGREAVTAHTDPPSGDPDEYQWGAAWSLAAAGGVVFVPDIRSFGTTSTGEQSEHRHFTRLVQAWGGSALGLFVEDALFAISIARSHPLVDPARVSTAGISLGGLIATLAAASDESVEALSASSTLGVWSQGLTGGLHCECMYVSGLQARFELSGVVALIAPRPAQFVHGTHDPHFPVTLAREALAESRPACQTTGAADAIRLDLTDGGHQWEAAPHVAFLRQLWEP